MIRAYANKVVVSDVPEPQSVSRLVVVRENNTVELKRGIVVDASPGMLLNNGEVVYYHDHGSQKIGDSIVIDASWIWAYEDNDS